METRVLQVLDACRDHKNIEIAAAVLRKGGLVALPTETVYGIGADGLNPSAVAKIFVVKGRPQDNPLILHIAEEKELARLVTGVPASAQELVRRFWPGPLTLILPKSGLVPGIVSTGLPTVAVRMPSHPVARELIRLTGCPLAAPSANLSGSPSTTTAEHCVRDLGGKVEIVLDGGPCAVGLESTVLSLAGGVPRLLRPGAVTLEALREVLGEVEVDPAVEGRMEDAQPVSSPGMKYRHYAPRAQVTLVHGDAARFAAFLSEREAPGVFALCFEEEAQSMPVPHLGYGSRDDSATQAKLLFAALRELDERGAQTVYAHAPDREGIGLAIYNRLLRAAGFREVRLTK